MSVYANVHIALEQMRVRALAAVRGSPVPEDEGDDTVSTDPPRVLVLGPENSGKTTVCKILANYAVRAGQDWVPAYVNVDPSEVGPIVRMVLYRIIHNSYTRICPMSMAHAGSLECPWGDIRGTYHCAYPDVFARVCPWLYRDVRPEPRLLKRFATPFVLVWAC